MTPASLRPVFSITGIRIVTCRAYRLGEDGYLCGHPAEALFVATCEGGHLAEDPVCSSCRSDLNLKLDEWVCAYCLRPLSVDFVPIPSTIYLPRTSTKTREEAMTDPKNPSRREQPGGPPSEFGPANGYPPPPQQPWAQGQQYPAPPGYPQQGQPQYGYQGAPQGYGPPPTGSFPQQPQQQQPPPARKRHGLRNGLIVAGSLAVVIIIIAAAAGSGSPKRHHTALVPKVSSSSSAPASSGPVLTAKQQKYVNDIGSDSKISATAAPGDLVSLGKDLCGLLKRGGQSVAVQVLKAKMSISSSREFVKVTERDLCPSARPHVIARFSGNGDTNTAQFVIPDSGNWVLRYSYNCSNAGGSGNFIVGEGSSDFGGVDVNELGAGATNKKSYVYGDSPGAHHLEILSECSWSVVVQS